MDADLAARADDSAREASRRRWRGRRRPPRSAPLTCACGPTSTSSPICAGVARRPADERVLHDHGALPDLDAAVLGGEHGAEQDPRAGADVDVPAHDRVGRHVRGRIDRGFLAAVLDEHVRVSARSMAPRTVRLSRRERARGAPPAGRRERSRLQAHLALIFGEGPASRAGGSCHERNPPCRLCLPEAASRVRPPQVGKARHGQRPFVPPTGGAFTAPGVRCGPAPPISRITRAGTPPASTPAGRSRVTTAPAPTTVSSPIVTPGTDDHPAAQPDVVGDGDRRARTPTRPGAARDRSDASP